MSAVAAVEATTAAPARRLTPEEYLAQERRTAFKSEYRDGEIIAMAGASLAHIRINANLMRHLGNQLDGTPCEALGQDLKIRSLPTRYSYPDVTIVCAELEFLDENQDVITNPTVILEILSESTEAYDRGDKFLAYQQRASLQEYVLVAQDRISVEHYTRQGDGNVWLYERLDRPDARLRLPSVGAEVALSDVYRRVDVAQRAGG